MAVKLTAYNVVLIEELICNVLTSALTLGNFIKILFRKKLSVD
jgi:hypothetical protein